MRLGLHLGLSMTGFEASERVALLHEAEALGFDSLWSGESTGSDAATQLAWAAAMTERIGLGTAVLQMPARTPAATAMTAVALDRLSGGRVRIGIGASTPAVAADWHGAGIDGQLRRTREYVEVLRLALDGERVRVDGRHWRLPALGSRPIRMTERAVQAHVPVLLAALGPRSVRLAGEIADGWMPNHCTPQTVREGLARAAAGAPGGRLAAGFEVVLNLLGWVDEDAARARDALRPILALYVGMGDPSGPYQMLMRRQGFEDVADAVHAELSAGRVREAQAALPARFIDAVALCGPRDVVAAKLAAYRDAGVTTIVPFVPTDDVAVLRGQVQRLAEVGT